MNPKPVQASRPSIEIDESLTSSHQEVSEGLDEEDPFSLSGTSIALFGLSMAIAVVGIPLVAVLTERPMERETLVPTASQSNGSKPSPTFTITRSGQFGS